VGWAKPILEFWNWEIWELQGFPEQFQNFPIPKFQNLSRQVRHHHPYLAITDLFGKIVF